MDGERRGLLFLQPVARMRQHGAWIDRRLAYLNLPGRNASGDEGKAQIYVAAWMMEDSPLFHRHRAGFIDKKQLRVVFNGVFAGHKQRLGGVDLHDGGHNRRTLDLFLPVSFAEREQAGLHGRTPFENTLPQLFLFLYIWVKVHSNGEAKEAYNLVGRGSRLV